MSLHSAFSIFFTCYQVFPDECPVFQDHVTVLGIILGHGYRTGVEIGEIIKYLTGRDMCMPAQQYLIAERQRLLLIIGVTVGCGNGYAIDVENGIVSHYREFQNHLVNLSLTVASYG